MTSCNSHVSITLSFTPTPPFTKGGRGGILLHLLCFPVQVTDEVDHLLVLLLSKIGNLS